MPYFTRKEQQQIIRPLLKKMEDLYQPARTAIIGIQGGQGTGKTTLSNLLQKELQLKGYSVISFSIDDFYLSLTERDKLRRKYPHNPFYQISRGLPGTHRLSMLQDVLRSLKAGKPTKLPLFDKSVHHGQGDISPLTTIVSERQDFVLFEGWCVGIPAVRSPVLIRACQKNDIPLTRIDPSLQHHKVVLEFIERYQPLWRYIDYFIMLKPILFSSHLRWRQQQERELRKKKGQGMTPEEVHRFVEPYLPFTALCYERIKPNALITINRDHTFQKILF